MWTKYAGEGILDDLRASAIPLVVVAAQIGGGPKASSQMLACSSGSRTLMADGAPLISKPSPRTEFHCMTATQTPTLVLIEPIIIMMMMVAPGCVKCVERRRRCLTIGKFLRGQ